LDLEHGVEIGIKGYWDVKTEERVAKFKESAPRLNYKKLEKRAEHSRWIGI